ncbi:MAG: hypothetical protein ACK8QZ_05485 [Anaerolineales bacterium]
MIPRIYLETLYAEILASGFQQLLRQYHFELKCARYDFSPKEYDINMLIFQSEKYNCNLLFVYPGGTVEVYIGPGSSNFDSNEWIRIDYLSSFFAQTAVVAWHGSSSSKPEVIIRDVLSILAKMSLPFFEQMLALFLYGDYKKQIATAKQYAVEKLQQK